MKAPLLMLLAAVAISAYAFQSPPMISNNVHVITNATPQQCKSYESGKVAPSEQFTVNSRFGSGNGEGNAGVRSCNNCKIDPASNDCVCASCYSYYN